VRAKAKTYKGQDGQTYIKIDQMQIKIVPGRSKLELKNLFDNNPSLKVIGSAFIDSNTGAFVNDIIPVLEKNLATTFTKVANEIVKESSYDELFPTGTA
jgi:Haemolymph juvenile hormone binding protein (JHBP)